MLSKPTSSSSNQLLHSVKDARKSLGGIGNSKFYELVKKREIRLVKMGRRSFVTDDELCGYVVRLSERAASRDAPDASRVAAKDDDAAEAEATRQVEGEEVDAAAPEVA